MLDFRYSVARPQRKSRRMWARVAATSFIAILVSTTWAAPATFPTVTTPVKVNGAALGGPLTPTTRNSLRNAIVFDSATNLYYLWFLGADTGALADYSLAKVQVYSSTDGINFDTFIGTLNPPANWWTAINGGLATAETVEPLFNFLRVQKIAGVWTMQVWNANGSTGDYNYNTTVWTIGAAPANLNILQQGPLPTLGSGGPPRNVVGPGGNQVGSFGMVNGNIYLRHDTPANGTSPGGGLGRYAYAAGTPPTTSAFVGVDAANLFTGTGWCWGLDPTCLSAATTSYVHNYGRTLSQGGTVLGTYYSFRDWNSSARREKQLWYVESANDGVSWGAPQALFTNGAAVTVDGLPNGGNFSLPEIAELGGGTYRPYFSTTDACGNVVMVTNSSAAAQRGLNIVKSFTQKVLPVGGSTTLTVTLTAPTATCAPAPIGAVYSGIAYSDNFPANMTLTTTPLVSNSCGGAVVANSGGGSFSVSGVSLNAGQACSVVVNVQVAAAGSYPNVIPKIQVATNGGVSNNQSVPALADANDTVLALALALAVPALPELSLLALGILLLVTGVRRQRRRNDQRARAI